ncbi:type VI secretion system baseplate subunit TssK [Proteus mirabilis]|uniref:type VI secretion system baseplate subunit TssK n=1 Tax=Proteus mirabilis TaxID=584 RepID=UPI000F88685E|nr:type VI secretion system baseplate subunit TssK [Proteus mirabilis]RUL08989.1 type VI secretion system baseplate subunit TssK [Proteus mirabilis]WJI12199.1 type VI secretion system baseplate subunit TssK [Proteus mirabilis]HEK0776095.1 type VI secretion system baseplate subunit TssK [Proteus mirabilis]
MKQAHKVVWTEGMFLRPHHFQQSENYLEQYIRSWGMAHNEYYWGFTSLDIDENALRQGNIALNAATGILPDGSFFSFYGANEAPLPLNIPEGKNITDIVLALPIYREGKHEVSFHATPDPQTRYLAYEKEIEDMNTITVGSAELQLGKLQLKLLPKEEVTSDWCAIGVLKLLEKSADGSLKIDTNYIPPMLVSQANTRLSAFVIDILGLLQQRSQQLGQRLNQSGRGGISETSDFMMLQLINRYIGITHHFHKSKQLHPERIFAQWLSLACELMTFSPSRAVGKLLPTYDHDNLALSFDALMKWLRQGLSIVFEENAIQLPLVERSHGLHIATVPYAEMLNEFGFVIAVHADVPTDILRSRFPAQLKIAPVNSIRDLVQLQLPGIGLNCMSVAPRQLPYHAGYTYFELENSGDLWKKMRQSGAFALHLAGDFPGLNMEFWAIRHR